ncbi:MAG: tRNA pseudouridine(55) synthase TruB [Nitrospirota bacterium]|jgi:tRNA pseudouridine55 synthase
MMPVHVVVNLDKPGGITSHDAVAKVKRSLRVKRAGHAGTLDPIATGVLLVCVGEATKVSRFLMDLGKEYLATLKFGERTDTLDSQGRVIERVEGMVVEREDVERVLRGFRGTVTQKPPMYSAVKVSGTALHKLARKGLDVQRPSRTVTIHDIRVEDMDFPFLTLRVSCSRGTYIRTLVDDIGRALGTVAHMTALRRTRVGSFRAEEAAGPGELPEKAEAMYSVDAALSHLQAVALGEKDYAAARHGRPVRAGEYGRYEDGQFLRLKGPGGALFAVGRAQEGLLRVERMLHLEGQG